MKKKILTILLIITITLLTGCIKRYDMEGINIITTIYPIEYVTKRLYGESANIKSIYPNGVDINEYKLTNKQLKDFSNNDLLIYNGNSTDREYATVILQKNKNIKIIDASYGLEETYAKSDIWLNPSNILMLAQNIKQELSDYIENPYLKQEINNNYKLLKLDISELDTELNRTAKNSNNKKIISYDESLKFLEKYGFEVINLTKNGKEIDSNIKLATSLLNNKSLSYIFVNEWTKDNELVTKLTKETSSKTLLFKSLATITDEDINKIISNYSDEDKLLCMIGSFTEQKNHMYMLDVMKELPSNYKLILLGDGKLKDKIVDKINVDNLSERVVMLGFRNNIAPIVKASDLVVIPSKWEGFGLVAAEAMACGKQIVCNDVDGLSEVVGDVGVKVNINNKNEFKDAIIQTIEYGYDQQKCIDQASRYDIKNMVKLYIDLYNRSIMERNNE